MGLIDKDLQCALAQADVRGAAAYYSTHCINLGARKNIIEDRGHLQIRVDEAFVGGTSVKFELVGSDTPWTAVVGTGATNVVVLAATDAIVTASLTADTIVAEFALPQKLTKKYIGVRATGVGTFSAGTFDANIVIDTTIGLV